MPVSDKSRRRLKVLLAVSLALIILGAGGYALRKRQVAARILRDRDAGYAALASGEYFTALHKIGPFLQRNPDDLEALKKYAIARSQVEEPNGKHLVDAMSLFRRALELQDDQEVRRRLLDLYVDNGFNTEALSSTDGRTDPESLRARAIALARLNRIPEALKCAQEYCDKLRPEDLQMQEFTVGLLLRQGTPARQVLERAAKLQAAHPQDPRFDLLMASTCLAVNQPREEALKWVNQAISKPIADPDLIDAAISHLDNLGEFDKSMSLLNQAAAAGAGDIRFRRKVIARLYQTGHYSQVVEQTAAEKDQARADVELLGHRAMALVELERRDEAKAITNALGSRSGDLAAAAWAGVLAVLPDNTTASSQALAILQACREALKVRPDNPYFRLCLGDGYSAAGEPQAAMQEWVEAAKLAPVWAVPRARVLRVLVAGGRSDEARQLADLCARLAPDDPRVIAVVAWARARLLPAADSPEVAEVLKLIDRVQQMKPGEESTLALKVGLLAWTGQKDEARGIIDAVLQSTAKQGPSQAVLLALARASGDAKLGLEQACFDRCRALHGTTSRLALAEAAQLIRSGGPAADAVKAFELAREGAPDRDDLPWRIAWAQLLDVASDPRAGQEWAALADREENDLVIQQGALAARSTQEKHDLLRRCIDRLGKSIGDVGMMWRLADARWHMRDASLKAIESERDQSFARAATILNDLTIRSPDLFQARLLLSECMLRLGNREGAIKQLTEADRLAPASVELLLQLASLIQAGGDFQKSRPYLDRAEDLLKKMTPAATQPIAAPEGPIARAEPSDESAPTTAPSAARTQLEASWRRLAALLAGRGEVDRAAAILARLEESDKTIDVGLADLRSQRGELTDQMCQEILDKPTPVGLGIVADHYARSGRQAEADAVLTKLDKIEAPPGERELVRARYLQQRGRPAEAIEQFRAACAAAPQSRSAARVLVGTLLQEGRADEAISAAGTAQKNEQLKDDAALERVVEQGDLVRAVAADARARGLLPLLAGDTEKPEVLIAALKVLRDSRGKTAAQVAAELKPLADSAARIYPLQDLLINLDLRCGNVDEAVLVATRSMQLAPADPLPAQRAAEVLAEAQRWDEVASVARDWRKRLGSRTYRADLMLAMADLAGGRFADAADTLLPHVDAARRDPRGFAQLYPLYAQALIGLGRTADARAFYEPVLDLSQSLRTGWMMTAFRIPEPAVPAEWLRRVATAIPADAISEKVALCIAWDELAKRRKDPAIAQASNAIRQEVGRELASAPVTTAPSAPGATTRPSATAGDWLAMAMLMEGAGDPAAESAYRTCLSLDPNQPLAQNNLAMLLVHRGGDTSEALALAEHAAAADHPSRPDFLDTLAQVRTSRKEFDQAQAALEQAMRLRPYDAALSASRVELLLKWPKPKEARAAFNQLETMVTQSRQQPDERILNRLSTLRQEIAKLDTSN